MKIIPHPALLKEKEEQIRRAQNELAQRARELHVLEVMLESQMRSEKRKKIDMKIYQLGIFLAGFVTGSLFIFFVA